MWIRQILQEIVLAVIGFSAGVTVAGGLFAFIVELGIIADFADRTHTAEHILLYEDSAALGGTIGSLLSVFPISLPFGRIMLPVFGGLAGIFVGCWSMALAEMLNVFPIFMRRMKIVRYAAAFIISMALGRGVGALVFFLRGW